MGWQVALGARTIEWLALPSLTSPRSPENALYYILGRGIRCRWTAGRPDYELMTAAMEVWRQASSGEYKFCWRGITSCWILGQITVIDLVWFRREDTTTRGAGAEGAGFVERASHLISYIHAAA